MNSEDIIRMARKSGYGEAMADLHAPALERFAKLVAASEREECARVCDEVFEESNNYRTQGYASHCAAAIRARGKRND